MNQREFLRLSQLISTEWVGRREHYTAECYVSENAFIIEEDTQGGKTSYVLLVCVISLSPECGSGFDRIEDDVWVGSENIHPRMVLSTWLS